MTRIRTRTTTRPRARSTTRLTARLTARLTRWSRSATRSSAIFGRFGARVAIIALRWVDCLKYFTSLLGRGITIYYILQHHSAI